MFSKKCFNLAQLFNYNCCERPACSSFYLTDRYRRLLPLLKSMSMDCIYDRFVIQSVDQYTIGSSNIARRQFTIGSTRLVRDELSGDNTQLTRYFIIHDWFVRHCYVLAEVIRRLNNGGHYYIRSIYRVYKYDFI